MAAQRVSGLQPRVYRILELAVEDGVTFGWRRGWKHLDGAPENDVEAQVCDQICQAVVGEILEAFAVVEPEDQNED